MKCPVSTEGLIASNIYHRVTVVAFLRICGDSDFRHQHCLPQFENTDCCWTLQAGYWLSVSPHSKIVTDLNLSHVEFVFPLCLCGCFTPQSKNMQVRVTITFKLFSIR